MGIRLLCKHRPQRRLSLVLPVSLAIPGLIAALSVAAISSAGVSDAAPANSAHGSGATAARVMYLNLTTTLRLVGRPGHVDTLKGTVSGTLSGSTTGRFVSLGSTGGEGTFTIYPSTGGSLFGREITHGHAVGPTAYFSGTVSITGGTGRWAHASGRGLTYSGTFNRQNYHATSLLRGNIRV